MNQSMEIKPLELAERACQTMMAKFKAEELPPVGQFHYHQGVFLSGMEQTFLSTGKREYSDYIKAWVDSLIDSDGNVQGYDTTTLDDKQAAILLFRLYDETGENRYEKAIHYIKSGLDSWPCNEFGGFWHKNAERTQNQMWLDGLYMAGELLMKYGTRFQDESCFDTVFLQARLMWEHMRDKETGLLYHAWDSTRRAPWADAETGCSPHFWGRAAGWYIAALTIILDAMPADYPHRNELIAYAKAYIEAFTKYQDEESGLWYQVIDQPNGEGNWTETSCTALFLFGISKAIQAGYISEQYRAAADKAFRGLADAIEEDGKGGIILPRICIGTGVGDYQHYIKRPTSENDLHGMGALLLACNAYHHLTQAEV